MESRKPGRVSRTVSWVGVALAFFAGATTLALAAPPDEAAITAVLADYARAIETRNLELFHTVKPVLSADEELRLQAAFANTESHSVSIKILSVEVKDARATVRLARRDTIGSLVASFPQKILLAKGPKGWTIEEIGK